MANRYWALIGAGLIGLVGCSGLSVDVNVSRSDASQGVVSSDPAPTSAGPSTVTVVVPPPSTVTATETTTAPVAPPPAPTQAPATSEGRVPESGTYYGYAYQRDMNGVRLDDDYLVEMTYSGAGSTIRYPELGCTGNLIPQGFNEGRRVYTEVITSGTCDNNGTWEVDVQSDYHLEATYRPQSGRYFVVASVDR